MFLNIDSFNARGLRDLSKAVCLLRNLLSFGVDVLRSRKHFVCEVDARVLSSDYVVYSDYIRGPAGQRYFLAG